MSTADAGGRFHSAVVEGSSRRVFCRAEGRRGAPALVFLHGGWGYGVYPLPGPVRGDLAGRFRLLIPDRTGYGRSARLADLPPGFHRDAALETLGLLDALGVERAALWGHSDGAVSAAIAAALAPGRVTALVLEAAHVDRCKPGSRGFFEAMVGAPESFGRRVAAALEADHGAGWRDVLSMEGRAWLAILDGCEEPEGDLYGGRLGDVAAPTLVLHGARDPRTEPGELEELVRRLPGAELHVAAGGGHSPHDEPGVAEASCRAVRDFLFAAA